MIPNPDKILCVGLNYQEHVVETGRDNTEQPAIFIRLPESQVGHRQPILRPRESKNLDFEAEIAIIIGKGRSAHLAGQGVEPSPATAATTTARCGTGSATPSSGPRNFARTGGFGPWMVTADEIPPGTKMTLSAA